MSVLFFDGFETIQTSDYTNKWDLVSGTWGGISTSFGRWSSRGVRLQSGGYTGSGACQAVAGDLRKDFSSNYTNGVIGFNFRKPSSMTTYKTANMNPVVRIHETATEHCGLDVNATGTFYFTRGGANVQAAVMTPLTGATWYFVEIKFTISNTSGFFQIRVNNQVVLTFNGDTASSANEYWNRLYFAYNGCVWETNGNWYEDFDDIYVVTNDGVGQTDYIGDCRQVALLPSGDGTTVQFSRGGSSPTANNYQSVDEAQSNGDIDYVYENVSGEKDTYAYSNLPSVINGVVALSGTYTVRKTDTGNPQYTVRVRTGTSEADSSAVTVVSASYITNQTIMETNPVTTAAWTLSDVNNGEFGIKVV